MEYSFSLRGKRRYSIVSETQETGLITLSDTTSFTLQVYL